jgi:hypothetical protein
LGQLNRLLGERGLSWDICVMVAREVWVGSEEDVTLDDELNVTGR